MASYTTSLRLVQPATGEYSGTWGTQVNTGLTALVDTSIAGTASITMTTADYTLSTANGASDEARAMVLNLTGTPGAARNVICPAVSKVYIVYNNTTGGFAQTLKTSAGTGISVPNGKTAFLRCDGTNVVEAVNYAASLTLGAALPTGSGGTGLTSFTSGGVVYASSTSALATGSGLVFDGTNLGIGTSSPGNPLDVTKTGIQIGSTTAYSVARFRDATPNKGVSLGYDSGSQTGIVLAQTASASSNLAFWTYESGVSGWAERMRLDSSGNLGLGVTPSAWVGDKAFQVNWGSVSSGYEYSVNVSSVAYRNNATWYYQTSSQAPARYEQITGQHRWYTAPSGTAGNAISFTQAMTLDASGRLGIGESSPTAPLHITNSSSVIRIQTTGAISTGAGTAFLQINSTDGDSGYIGFGGTASTFDIYNRLSGAMTFATNNAERARITSGGDLLVGATATSTNFDGKLNVAGRVHLKADSGTTGLQWVWNTTTTGDNSFVVFGTETTYTGRGSISYNRAGGLVSYNTTSDYRAKEILGPVANPGATIDALKVYEGRMKGATQSRPMLVAHEAQAVAPYSVTGEKDAVNEDGTPKFQQMDVSSLVPLLLAEIQSLRARVAQLESKA